ncbi:uncharacterized protein LOC129980793 [Argiope bruennichi]|uniref:uncharacterized protein LOC129980793 n=1 Tax=Argiope bruennichi TaxID=94029 RepID=UPI002494ED32|nr:uncharacterized protein LOC129980793 [Argiope bruennichi]
MRSAYVLHKCPKSPAASSAPGDTSSRFCCDCKILFVNKKALREHNNNIHNPLRPAQPSVPVAKAAPPTQQPKTADASNSSSCVRNLSGALGVSTPSTPPTPPEPRPLLPCADCNFLAKTRKGLRFHRYRQHSVPIAKRSISRSQEHALPPTPQDAKIVSPPSSGAYNTIHPDRAGCSSDQINSTLPSNSQSVVQSPDLTYVSPSSRQSTRHTPAPDNIPSELCRIGNSLNILFPIEGCLSCPELDCSSSFVSKSWNSMKGNLLRHFRREHSIQIKISYFWCALCKCRIAKAPSSHSCLQNSGPILPPLVPFNWRCNTCPASFTSENGLKNHSASHVKDSIASCGPQLQLAVPKRRRRRRLGVNPNAASNVDESISHPSAVLLPPNTILPTPPPSNNANGDDTSLLAPYIAVLDEMLAVDPDDNSYNYFQSTLDQALAEIYSSVVPGGPGRRGQSKSGDERIDIENAEVCQKLYRRNRRRAIREITGVSGDRCCVPTSTLDAYFRDAWGQTLPLAFMQLAPTSGSPFLLHSSHRQSWKTSTTILLPKAGDPTLPTNWRPIALSSTIYKIFTKCLTRRLDAVRYLKKDLCIGWLDVSNAFGALPHQAIFEALEAVGTGPLFVDIIRDLYRGSRTKILSDGGVTSDIPILSGVKQGCPISGLLFNICIDPVIRSIQGDHVEHKVLAFDDDLCLLAASPDELQNNLDSVQAQLAALGMVLNPKKSVSLHFSGCTPVGVKNTCFRVGSENISPLKEGEFTRFLGRPVGFNAWPDFNSLNDLSGIGAKILSSALAPWQRLDALKSFFFPALQFPMRTAQFQKTAWQALDSTIRGEIKNTLGLPENAANAYLYGHKSKGSCSIPIAAEESDLNRIDTAFKLLTSSDEEIVLLATEDLRQTISHRLKIPSPFDANLEDFLSGVMEGPFSTFDNAYSNVWTCARLAFRRLGVVWEFDDGVPRVKYNEIVVRASGRRKVIFSIRDRLRNNRSTALINKPSQGKAMECVAQSPASSHFIADGTYTRFADWRFVHRTRLNLLPLNGSQVWKEDKRCRRCNEADLETLPHVLNHCKGKSRGWQLRHDTIVARVKKALATRCTIISENQRVGPDNLRPDLVVQSGNRVFIVDVTIPFENRMEGFEKAKRLKHDKYASLLPLYSSNGMQAAIIPIVVGALGAWDPENDRFLSKYMSRGYLNKFRKLCVSDCIKWSRDIYVEHISGHRQFTDGVDLAEHLTPPEPPSDL